jgi:hypothetical protein
MFKLEIFITITRKEYSFHLFESSKKKKLENGSVIFHQLIDRMMPVLIFSGFNPVSTIFTIEPADAISKGWQGSVKESVCIDQKK